MTDEELVKIFEGMIAERQDVLDRLQRMKKQGFTINHNSGDYTIDDRIWREEKAISELEKNITRVKERKNNGQ